MELQGMAKDVFIFTKVAKFRQIWSHCLRSVGREREQRWLRMNLDENRRKFPLNLSLQVEMLQVGNDFAEKEPFHLTNHNDVHLHKCANFVKLPRVRTHYHVGPVWPDWAIYWTLGNFSKPLAIINLPKSPTFLGNFCKGVKSFLCLVKSFLGNFYRHLTIFIWSHCVGSKTGRNFPTWDQCDQIWRIYATLAKVYQSFANFRQIIPCLEKYSADFGKFLTLSG